jgi:hypothetical protein
MVASGIPRRPALIRVATVFDVLTRRTRSLAEHREHMRLQAEAERALLALLDSLGELDEQPIRAVIGERVGGGDAS